MNKKGIAPLFILLGILGLFFVVGSQFNIGSFLNYNQVYKQNWGVVECVQNFDYDVVYTRYADDVKLFKCSDYTNECKIIFKLDRDPPLLLSIGQDYQICDINGDNCGGKLHKGWNSKTFGGSKDDFLEFTLDVGKSVKLLPDTASRYLQVTKKAKSFYIRGQENGKVYVQESCVLSNELRGKVLKDGLNELTKIGVNSRQNYLIDFVSVATQTYSYNGKQVVCQARQLYDTLPNQFIDGSTKLFQGNLIKSVQCCPTEANCGENFLFKVNNVRSCSINSECANGGNPIAKDSTHVVRYVCSSGECQEGAIEQVECTNTQACIQKFGQGSVCDMSNYNFGKCIKSTKPNYCGDGICQDLDGENGNTCQEDCGLKCAKGQVVKTTCSGGIFSKQVCEKRCSTPSKINQKINLEFFQKVMLIVAIGLTISFFLGGKNLLQVIFAWVLYIILTFSLYTSKLFSWINPF